MAAGDDDGARPPCDPIHMASKGKPAVREITTCWSCERPVALKPGCKSYHCESCDVQGSDEPALIRDKVNEQAYYFLSWNGRTRVEHYVEHNGSTLSSPA